MISTSNLNEARKEIQQLKKENKTVIVQAQSNEFNRKILENKEVDIITDLELHKRKDKLKQRDSGLNEILCKLASKNNIKIEINLDKIKQLDKKEKAETLARIKQNISLCKRTNAKIVFLDNIKKQDVLSFFLTLKGNTKQATEAMTSSRT